MNKTFVIVSVIILIIIAGGVYFLVQPKATLNQNMQNQNQGMKVEILQQGTGEGAKVGDNITVDYTGTLADGTKFDSSVDPSFGHVMPFPYTLGQNMVIQGWELGLLGMKAGEKRRLTIPPELAYGPNGRPPTIPANATLIFEITMVSINGK
ncbi:MAG: FKBP-type peptidyl-prolyl cis-trans isomerase [Candidatus Staskawiczbacteria bacterium]|nr:FKBP-type peptidyl-prolyl cis-trans isomerase [Candidatus Staskawiczbacteria bacterium]